MMDKIQTNKIKNKHRINRFWMGLVAGLVLCKPAEQLAEQLINTNKYTVNHLKSAIKRVLQEEKNKAQPNNKTLKRDAFYITNLEGKKYKVDIRDIDYATNSINGKSKDEITAGKIKDIFFSNLMRADVPLREYTKNKIDNIFNNWNNLPDKIKEALIKFTNSYLPLLNKIYLLQNTADAYRKKRVSIEEQISECNKNKECSSEQLNKIIKDLNVELYELSKEIYELRKKAYHMHKSIKESVAHHMPFENYFAISYIMSMSEYYTVYKKAPKWEQAQARLFMFFEDEFGIPLTSSHLRDELVNYLWLNGIQLADREFENDGTWDMWSTYYTDENDSGKLVNFLNQNKALFRKYGINPNTVIKAKR